MRARRELIRAPEAACDLLVTLGASSTSLSDRADLVDDLDDLAAEITTAADSTSRRYIESAHSPPIASTSPVEQPADADD